MDRGLKANVLQGFLPAEIGETCGCRVVIVKLFARLIGIAGVTERLFSRTLEHINVCNTRADLVGKFHGLALVDLQGAGIKSLTTLDPPLPCCRDFRCVECRK